MHPVVHVWPDAAGGGFDYTGKKLSHTGSRQMKLQQEGFQLDVKKDDPFGEERKVISWGASSIFLPTFLRKEATTLASPLALILNGQHLLEG